jgi:hypothetical protein
MVDAAQNAEKYAALHEIGRDCGFIAPRVLSVGPGHVRLERINDLVPLRDLYLGDSGWALDRAVENAGESLAKLHANLPRHAAVPWSPPPGFLDDLGRYLPTHGGIGDLPLAILHCDYSFTNVCCVAANADRLAIIDPCPNYGSTFDCWAYAPIYIDIGKMFACLEGQVAARFQHRRPSPARVVELQEIFLVGYERFGSKVNVATANAFAFAVAAAQFRKRYGSLAFLRRSALYNRMRGNFPCWRKLGEI